MAKVIGFRPTPEQDYFLDLVRGDISKGDAIKKIIDWLRNFGPEYAINAGIFQSKPCAPMTQDNLS